MAEHRLRNPGGETPEDFDRDVDIRGAVYTGIGVFALAAVSFVLMWFFVRGLMSWEERRDPEPSPLPEAARALAPSGPSLQATPERELEALRVHERTILESYGVNEAGTHARIPIERAMALLLEQGIGTPAPGEPAAVSAGEVAPDETEPASAELAPGVEPTAGEEEERPDDLVPESPEGPDGP